MDLRAKRTERAREAASDPAGERGLALTQQGLEMGRGGGGSQLNQACIDSVERLFLIHRRPSAEGTCPQPGDMLTDFTGVQTETREAARTPVTIRLVFCLLQKPHGKQRRTERRSGERSCSPCPTRNLW